MVRLNNSSASLLLISSLVSLFVKSLMFGGEDRFSLEAIFQAFYLWKPKLQGKIFGRSGLAEGLRMLLRESRFICPGPVRLPSLGITVYLLWDMEEMHLPLNCLLNCKKSHLR